MDNLRAHRNGDALQEQTKKNQKDSKGTRITSLADRFPLLSQQPGLSIDLQEDLTLSDIEFGRRHKRGKSARFELLENMENRLQITPMRHRLSELESLVGRLANLLTSESQTFGRLVALPLSLEHARITFDLSFLAKSGEGLVFQLDSEEMLRQLSAVATDDLSRLILRELIIGVNRDVTAQDIADEFQVVRQAIYDRQSRIILKLDDLLSGTDFSFFVDFIRTNLCVVRGSKLTVSTAHPLIAILLLDTTYDFTVRDLVAVGLWGVARAETGKKKSFSLNGGGLDDVMELVVDV